jgi:putative membrane protein
MRSLITVGALGICIAVTGCNKSPKDTSVAESGLATNPAIPSETAAAAMTGQDFANTLAASDAFEIASSRLALTKASAPAIKDFAHKMIDAHTASTQKLKTAAAGLTPAIKPDPTLTSDQQQKLDGLKALAGSDFERAYVDDQIAGHETALRVVQTYSDTGDVPALKTIATDAVTMVSDHLKQARALTTAPATKM